MTGCLGWVSDVMKCFFLIKTVLNWGIRAISFRKKPVLNWGRADWNHVIWGFPVCTTKKNPLCLMLRRLPSSLITSGEEESAIFSPLPKHQCVSNGNSQRHSRFSNLFTVLSTLPRPANGRRAANYAKLWTASTAVGLMFRRYTFEVIGSLFFYRISLFSMSHMKFQILTKHPK